MTCLSQVKKGDPLNAFILGRQDLCDHLLIP